MHLNFDDISVANLYHILACFCSFTTFMFQKFATLSCVSVDFQHNALIFHDIDTFGDQALHSAMFSVSIVIGIDALSRFLSILFVESPVCSKKLTSI